jgi:D-methionine transport system substrate-binding protein
VAAIRFRSFDFHRRRGLRSTTGQAGAQDGLRSRSLIDEFKAGVEPELKKKGYFVRYFEFSTGLEANNAVFKGDIDANVMQHTVFLNSYNERQKTDLIGIVHVPTPPMGLHSKKHALGTPIKAGSTVAVPNDPVNLQRAL